MAIWFSSNSRNGYQRSKATRRSKKVKSLEESLEYTQAEQEEVKERVNTCEEDQMRRSEDELIRQSIYSRRWNLIIHGIKESESENCTDLVKKVTSSALKIIKDKVRSTRFLRSAPFR